MSELDKIFEGYIKEEGLGQIYTGDNEHVRRIYQDFNDAILFQLERNLAVYFLHKLTELTDIEVEDYTYKTHPISDQRTSNHGAMIQTYLQERLAGEQFDVASVEVFGPSVIMEIAMPGYARLFNKEILDDRLLFFHSKQGLPYINAVRQGWNEIRDELEKYSYVKLASNDELLEDRGLFDYNEILNKKRDNYVDRGSEIQ